MRKIGSIFKSKKVIFIVIVLSLIAFVGLWNVVSGGYDKQNKTIIFLKKIVPIELSRNIRDTVFVIPNLKERNKFLSNQVKKYEQGLNGELFNEEIIISKKGKQKFLLKEFYLPFPRLDYRLGWAATENSLRAHYLTIVKDKVLVISGEGKTIYFKKNNIKNNKLNQIEIKNNIQNIINDNSFKLIGIRDLFVDEDKVYISMIIKDSNGYTINIYNANLNFDKFNFELFFQSDEYWDEYNVFSGGRFSKFKNNKILFTIGFSNVKNVAQKKNSLLGKIISIDKSTGQYQIISMGHRNPQGLYYIKNLGIIINTEHGPKGGDEININFHNDGEIPNFGWDVASYGQPYSGPDLFKKSHKENGFVEPLKYYVPSIGISQLVYMSNELNLDRQKHIFVSSLRAGSIYVIKINEKFNKILHEDRIYFPQQRIRDIEYDKENNLFLMLFEFTPSIGVLKLNN